MTKSEDKYISYDSKPYEDQTYEIKGCEKDQFSNPPAFDYRPFSRYGPSYNPGDYSYSLYDIATEREGEIIYMASKFLGIDAYDRGCFDKILRIRTEIDESAWRRYRDQKLIKLLEEE